MMLTGKASTKAKMAIFLRSVIQNVIAGQQLKNNDSLCVLSILSFHCCLSSPKADPHAGPRVELARRPPLGESDQVWLIATSASQVNYERTSYMFIFTFLARKSRWNKEKRRGQKKGGQWRKMNYLFQVSDFK